MIKSRLSRTAKTYLKVNNTTVQSFWRYNRFESRSSLDSVFLTIRLTRIVMSIARRDRRSRSIVKNKWSNLEQTVQRENTWKSIARRIQSFDDTVDSRAVQYHDAFKHSTFNKYNFFDRVTDLNSYVKHHDFMSSILCCLLSRVYDAWRAESCQKHLQRLLFDLTERWVL